MPCVFGVVWNYLLINNKQQYHILQAILAQNTGSNWGLKALFRYSAIDLLWRHDNKLWTGRPHPVLNERAVKCSCVAGGRGAYGQWARPHLDIRSNIVRVEKENGESCPATSSRPSVTEPQRSWLYFSLCTARCSPCVTTGSAFVSTHTPPFVSLPFVGAK